MSWVTYLGIAAGILTTASFIPQVLKSWRSKHTGDLSLKMYLIMTTGVFLWLLYGIALKDIPLIVANAITLLFAGSILVLKVKYS